MSIGSYSALKKPSSPGSSVVRVSNAEVSSERRKAAEDRVPNTTNPGWASHAQYMKQLGNGAAYMFSDRALDAIGDALAASTLRGLPYEVIAEAPANGSRFMTRVVIEGSPEVIKQVRQGITSQAARIPERRQQRAAADLAAEPPPVQGWAAPAPIRDRLDQAPDMPGALEGFYLLKDTIGFSTDHGTLTEISFRETGSDNVRVSVQEAVTLLSEQLRNVSVKTVGGDKLEVTRTDGDKLFDLPPTFRGYRVTQKNLSFLRSQATMKDVEQAFVPVFRKLGLTVTPPWLGVDLQFEKEEGGSRLLFRPDADRSVLNVYVPYVIDEAVKGLEIGQLLPETFTDSAGKTWTLKVTRWPKPYTPPPVSDVISVDVFSGYGG